MNKNKYVLYFSILFSLILSFCTKNNTIEKPDYLINTENNINIIDEIDSLEHELITIYYFYNKQRVNNQQFDNYGFDSFNLDFTNEVSEKNLNKESAYYKVYYKGNNIIKYELYVNIPANDDDPISIHNNEIDFPSKQSTWNVTNYYIYNDNNQFAKIIEKNKYRITKIIIDYISDESAVYKTILNNKIIDEGKLFLNEDKKIIKHRSTFNRFMNP